MMNASLFLGLFAAIVMNGELARAHGDGKPSGKKNLPPTCAKVAELCEKAGFYEGGSNENKGLWMNCIMPIVKGEAVAGVEAGTLGSECRAEKEKLHGGGDKKHKH